MALEPAIGVPALSVITPTGQSSILIGSLHVGIAGVRQPDGSVFSNAKRLVIEHHGVPQPGDSEAELGATRAAWSTELSGQEIAVYLERTRCAGTPDVDALAYLSRRSAQWANQLAYTVCVGRVALSRDWIVGQLKPQGVKIDALEEDSEVEARRRSVPAHVGDASFRWILSRDPATVLGGIRDALNRGDYESVRVQSEASIGDVEDARIFNRIMVVERNAAWMPRLRQYLDEGGAVILVGAAHLPGPEGLIARLQADGYTVKTIVLPAVANLL